MLTPAQRASIDACVSINETGKLPSQAAYATVAILPDGAGISYGKHQATDQSGSLDAIVARYAALGGALALELAPYVDRLRANATTTAPVTGAQQWVVDLMDLLHRAGADPVMQRAQDEVFDVRYWRPAAERCAAMGLVTPLAHLVVYDTCIHSGPSRVESLRKTFAARPPASGGVERVWVIDFLTARRKFLAGHSNPVVRKTVDRVDALRKLCDANQWELQTPFVYRFGLTVR
jgi:chitosanase